MSVHYSGPQLKRIVVTSSCAAVANPEDRGELDERTWNESNIREIEEKGREASQVGKYRASKSLAEKGLSTLASPILPAQAKSLP